MQTNEQEVESKYADYEKEQAEELREELESKFLEILSLPNVVIPADEIQGEFTEEQRAMLQSVLETEMLSPEEIAQSISIEKHNMEVQRAREERLARRRSRQVKKRRRR